MHTRTVSRVGAVGLVCALLLVGSAFSDSKARIVRLSYVSGDVQIDRAQGQGFERAVMNMPTAIRPSGGVRMPIASQPA